MFFFEFFCLFVFSSSLMLSLSLSLPSLSTKSSHLLDLPAHALRVGPRKVDLVQHRDDLQSGIQSQINVGERLGLDALASVDDEQRALAGRERARDLVAEVDVARSVDQVERVLDLLAVARSFAFAFFAVSLKPRRRPVAHPRRVELDGDPALALEVHPVEVLGSPWGCLCRCCCCCCWRRCSRRRRRRKRNSSRSPLIVEHEAAGRLQEPVGQGALPVVDVCDDAEVPENDS